jgi:phosphoribosyl 1,2-cyclic phosphodiesterase
MNQFSRFPFLNIKAFATIGVTTSWILTNVEKNESSCDTSNSTASKTKTIQPPKSKLLFLGSGSSSGCPRPLCSMLFQDNFPAVDSSIQNLRNKYEVPCRTSRLAMQGNPHENKDYRNNPSIVVNLSPPDDDSEATPYRNIIFDVGKTFREASLRWMPRWGIQSLDAVVLTHHHMDAVGGVDDLRGFQTKPTHVYMAQDCLDQVSKQFPWLFPLYNDEQDDETKVHRHVASLEVNVINEYEPISVEGLQIIPLPVWHGDDLLCMGYAFSLPCRIDSSSPTAKKDVHIVYFSDISRMKTETMDYIRNNLPPTDILIVDALLSTDVIHPVHFNMHQAVALSKEVGAKKTFVIGMSCESFPPHEETNSFLKNEMDIDISLAYDGLVLEF